MDKIMNENTTNNKCHNFIKINRNLIVAAILLLVLVFGFFYELTEMGHECSGDDCPICSCIQHLNELHYGRNSAVTTVCLILSLVVLSLGITKISEPKLETLVERKVRLNN